MPKIYYRADLLGLTRDIRFGRQIELSDGDNQ
jgi:hypothetical protein